MIIYRFLVDEGLNAGFVFLVLGTCLGAQILRCLHLQV